MTNSFKRDWLIWSLSYGCILIFLATAFAFNLLSPRLFAFAVLLSAIASFLLLFRIFRKAHIEGQLANQAALLDPKQVRRRLLWSKIGIVFWSILAVNSLWETRGGPLAPRLIGLCVSLAFLTGSIVALRQSHKLLQQQRSGD